MDTLIVLLFSLIVFTPFVVPAALATRLTLWIVRQWPALRQYWYIVGSLIFVCILLLTAFVIVASMWCRHEAICEWASVPSEVWGFLNYVFLGALPSVLMGLGVSLYVLKRHLA